MPGPGGTSTKELEKRWQVGLEKALKRVTSGSALRKAKRLGRDHLLLALEESSGASKSEILSRLSDFYGLPVAEEIQIPTPEIIRQSGLAVRECRDAGALPQDIGLHDRGALVVSDPSVINVKAFLERGTEIFLGASDEIERAWTLSLARPLKPTPESPEAVKALPLSEARKALCALRDNAVACGGTELFLGCPGPDAYEFIADGKRYAGKLHAGIYQALVEEIKKSGPVTLNESEDGHTGAPMSVVPLPNETSVVFGVFWAGSDDAHDVEGSDSEAIADSEKESGTESAGAARTYEAPKWQGRLLLIDDDGQLLGILGRLLSSHHYQVLRASSLEEAFALVAQGEVIDLVLCDVHMPEIGGAESVQYFRSRGIRAPVIFITADTDELLEAELALKGAYAVFRKGSDLRILLAWIRNAELRIREAEGELAVPESPA